MLARLQTWCINGVPILEVSYDSKGNMLDTFAYDDTDHDQALNDIMDNAVILATTQFSTYVEWDVTRNYDLFDTPEHLVSVVDVCIKYYKE